MQGILGAPQAGGYEFTQMENEAIRRTGSRATTWGTISIVGGIFLVIISTALAVAGITVADADSRPTALAASGTLLAFAVQPLLSGKFYRDAGAALRNVSDTQGNDIPLMMSAIAKLKAAFQLEAIAAIIGFVIGIVVGVVMVTQKG